MDCEAQYYCNDCNNKVKADEEELIKFSISKGTNISTIIKNEYIIDYVNPTSTTIFFKPMNIYKVVSEIIDGVKKDFVMIEFEEYNNYMLHIACSNKKLIDDEELNRKREKQLKQEETELKRINTINEHEERFKRREEKYKQSIEKEIQINRFHNEKIKKIKEDLKVEYKAVFDDNKDAKIQNAHFVKIIKCIQSII